MSVQEKEVLERFPHLCRAFGAYETNCYIVQTPQGEFIIDPGMGSAQWVLESSPNPLAILLTHGHFDHIFDVAKIKAARPEIPLYCPRDDGFMLESDCFDTGLTPYQFGANDVLVRCEKGRSDFTLGGVEISYLHFPGHTPGCSVVCLSQRDSAAEGLESGAAKEIARIQKASIYSGDFIFKRSIGRYDFPYSSAADMRESLQRFSALELAGLGDEGDIEIFPGHGDSTLLSYEQENVQLWIARI